MYHSLIIFYHSYMIDVGIKHNKLLQSFSCILPGYKIHSGTDQDIKYLIDTYISRGFE